MHWPAFSHQDMGAMLVLALAIVWLALRKT